MANTILQNVQRGTIFMELFTIFIAFVFLTIKLIKHQVDIK